ncbi:MAG: multidrug resistance protein [Chloroflexi bacterium]|nr:multidrug resistance protein [Chloroflexota bacterium]MCC6894939.1 multidrug resistance protein [Anaerolineae bacterium]
MAASTLPTPETPTKPNNANNIQSIGMVLASVAFGAVGQLILKAGMNSIVETYGKLQLTPETLIHMATNPLLIVGIGIFGVSTLLWLFALAKADLSFAYPFLSLTYLAVLIGGAFLFGDQVTWQRVLGFITIIAGVFIVARSERKKS